jgi:CRP/FNR family transcriptional regulator, cyclic AMP receptor protein
MACGHRLCMKTVSQPSTLAEKRELWKEIAAHPFLTGMNAHHLELLTRYATRKIFQPGEVIFRAGEAAHGFYLILTGSIVLEGSVMEHGPVATDIVHAGEPLGWSWLFPPHRWHFDARAIESTTAIYLDGDTLRRHYNEDITLAHDLSQRICKVMAHRLQATRRKLIETVHRCTVANQKSP